MNSLGIDLGGTKIEAVVLGADGSERWRRRIATPAGRYAETLQAMRSLVDAARAAGHGPFSIGLGTPGTATASGLMKNCNSECLNAQPLQRDLQALLGQPVAIANDANCLALSEATDGAGAGAEVVFAVILGTGTGAGIAVHGRVLGGPNGLAGEWGHNPLPWATRRRPATGLLLRPARLHRDAGQRPGAGARPRARQRRSARRPGDRRRGRARRRGARQRRWNATRAGSRARWPR